MKLSTVKEALEASEDEIILAIRGTLAKLWEIAEGDGQYGRWTLQSGTLKDSTGEIKVNFSNRDVVPKNWRGKVVEIRSTKKEKGGWTGCKRTVDNRKTNILQITSSADVFLFEQEHEPEPDDKPSQASQPNGHEKAPSSPQGASQAATKGNSAPPAEKQPSTASERLEKGMEALIQIANVQARSTLLVHQYVVPLVEKKLGITLDPIQVAALIQNMTIQAYRDRVHTTFFPAKKFADGDGPPTQ